MLGAWAARPPASFRPFALPTFLYVATEALAESTPLPQRGESTSLPLARKQRRWGGGGHTAKQKRGKPFRPPSTTTHDGSRHDTHMLVPAPLVCLALCGLDELHAPRHPHLPLPRADPHALTPRRAAFVLTCDAPLVSRRVERVGLCAVCALVDASSKQIFDVNRFYPKTQLSWPARLDHSHCNSFSTLGVTTKALFV